MPALATAMFAFALGEDAALLPRTAALTDAYHEMLAANQKRLARWEPWAAQPLTPESTRSFLEASERAWLEGTELPAVIAVPADDRWQLVGSAGLRRRCAPPGHQLPRGEARPGRLRLARRGMAGTGYRPLR
jgi:ribosomal-protein-serine acetyltransferase